MAKKEFSLVQWNNDVSSSFLNLTSKVALDLKQLHVDMEHLES